MQRSLEGRARRGGANGASSPRPFAGERQSASCVKRRTVATAPVAEATAHTKTPPPAVRTAASTLRSISTFPQAGQIRRCSISFLISPIACAGFKPFGQVRAQFMMVWQR